MRKRKTIHLDDMSLFESRYDLYSFLKKIGFPKVSNCFTGETYEAIPAYERTGDVYSSTSDAKVIMVSDYADCGEVFELKSRKPIWKAEDTFKPPHEWDEFSDIFVSQHLEDKDENIYIHRVFDALKKMYRNMPK